MAKPKAKKSKESVAKPKKSKDSKPSKGYEMLGKVLDQNRNWVRMAMSDRNNVGVDCYGIVKVTRADVIVLAEVHQQIRQFVGKRIIALSPQIADSLGIRDEGKVVVERPTQDEIDAYIQQRQHQTVAQPSNAEEPEQDIDELVA